MSTVIDLPPGLTRKEQIEAAALIACNPCQVCKGKVPMCSCTICCTLDVTVQFPGGDPIDITLTCGRTFDITNYVDCRLTETPEEHICKKFSMTESGGTGSYASGGGTVFWKTVIWLSDEETSSSLTGITSAIWAGDLALTGKFKVFFAATQYTLKVEGEDDVIGCCYQYGVIVEYAFTGETPYCGSDLSWGYYHRGSLEALCVVMYTETANDCPDPAFPSFCCPPGYEDDTPNTSFLQIACTPGTVSQTLTGCIAGEPGAMALTETVPGCLTITIADNC